MTDRPELIFRQNDHEKLVGEKLLTALKSSSMADEELLRNLPLFLRQKHLTHILFLADLYQRILPIGGNIAEFGSMWGRNLASFISLRDTYEPYNHTRKVIGFDTFEGFPSVSPIDGDSSVTKVGAYATSPDWGRELEGILQLLEGDSPLRHIRRFELVQGDVSVTVPEYLTKHPEMIFALCYFDLDLYQPTVDSLKAILPRLVKGSVLVFDELNCEHHPGETVAVQEVLGLNNIRLLRSPISGWKTYMVVGD